MKTNKYLLYTVLCAFALSFASCEPRALKPEDVFTTTDSTELDQILKKENEAWGGKYRIYTLNEFQEEFSSEKGDFPDSLYRTRSTDGKNGIFLFAIDTIPTDTIGIYIRGRISTDDYAGNFYKSMVIQQPVSWTINGSEDLKQQNLRISVDMGSLGGMFQIGQEVLIRCNGLSLGRYANQPQLCIPTYNNNIYATSANQKVGWAPGRIPSAQFRNAVKLIGTPDPSKLIYDECTLGDLRLKRGIKFARVKQTLGDMKTIRLLDGRLVRVKNVHFTGKYFDQDGNTNDCVYAHPDSVGEANVFAPTTGNVGYPQSRVITNKAETHTICVSNSEYCKFSHFFLPGARPDTTLAVKECKCWSGTITGILGWYFDNANYWNKLTSAPDYITDEKKVPEYGKEWSITPRGIPGLGIKEVEDICLNVYGDTLDSKSENIIKDTFWIPEEFDPVYYQKYKEGKVE